MKPEALLGSHESYCNICHSLRKQMRINLCPNKIRNDINENQTCFNILTREPVNINVDKKNQLYVTFCILYFSSNSCSTCFGQPRSHHQELTTA